MTKRLVPLTLAAHPRAIARPNINACFRKTMTVLAELALMPDGFFGRLTPVATTWIAWLTTSFFDGNRKEVSDLLLASLAQMRPEQIKHHFHFIEAATTPMPKGLPGRFTWCIWAVYSARPYGTLKSFEHISIRQANQYMTLVITCATLHTRNRAFALEKPDSEAEIEI